MVEKKRLARSATRKASTLHIVRYTKDNETSAPVIHFFCDRSDYSARLHVLDDNEGQMTGPTSWKAESGFVCLRHGILHPRAGRCSGLGEFQVSHNPHDCQYCQGTNCIFHGPYACGCSSEQRHTLQPRPSFHEYYTEMAKLVAKRATCIRRRVGAVVVRDNRVLATGYNGSPPGKEHCIDPGVGCLMVDGHCARTVHAEVNAIAAAARFGTSVDGADVYVTWEPCRSCRNILLSAGIANVHYSDGPNGPEQR